MQFAASFARTFASSFGVRLFRSYLSSSYSLMGWVPRFEASFPLALAVSLVPNLPLNLLLRVSRLSICGLWSRCASRPALSLPLPMIASFLVSLELRDALNFLAGFVISQVSNSASAAGLRVVSTLLSVSSPHRCRVYKTQGYDYTQYTEFG